MSENKSAYEELVEACRKVTEYYDAGDVGRTPFEPLASDLGFKLWIYNQEQTRAMEEFETIFANTRHAGRFQGVK